MENERRRTLVLTTAFCTLMLLTLATPGAAAETPFLEGVEDVTIRCEGGTQTVKISPVSAGANLVPPDACRCFPDAATAENWMQTWVIATLTPPHIMVLGGVWIFEVHLQPNEQEKSDTMYCYSPEQLAAYEKTLRALMTESAGSTSE